MSKINNENKRYTIYLMVVDNDCKLPDIEKDGFLINPGSLRFEDNLNNIEEINLDSHKEKIVKYFNSIKNEQNSSN